jgi:hypothetical protein
MNICFVGCLSGVGETGGRRTDRIPADHIVIHPVVSCWL